MAYISEFQNWYDYSEMSYALKMKKCWDEKMAIIEGNLSCTLEYERRE